MPSEFYVQLRKMKLCAITELVSCVLLIVFLSVPVSAIMAKHALRFVFISSIPVCLCAGIIAFCTIISRPRKELRPWRVRIRSADIVRSLGVSEIQKDAYAAFLSYEKKRVRLLVQYVPIFSKSELANRRKRANRAINARYQVPAEVPRTEIGLMLRINMVVCPEENEEMVTWVQHEAARLLTRNEAIINVAVVENTQELLFPACMGDLFFHQVSKYQVAAELLCSRLAL